jgi:hypothetical protein
MSKAGSPSTRSILLRAGSAPFESLRVFASVFDREQEISRLRSMNFGGPRKLFLYEPSSKDPIISSFPGLTGESRKIQHPWTPAPVPDHDPGSAGVTGSREAYSSEFDAEVSCWIILAAKMRQRQGRPLTRDQRPIPRVAFWR